MRKSIKSILMLLLYTYIMVFLCSCDRTKEPSIGSTKDNAETKVITDMYDRKEKKSYPNNSNGLVMFVSDIIGIDMKDHIDSIEGEIAEPYGDLIARVKIKSDSTETLLKHLNEYGHGIDSPEKYKDAVSGIYFPPGKDSDFQHELQESNLLGCKKIYYSGVYGQTCAYHVYIIDKDNSIELLIF